MTVLAGVVSIFVPALCVVALRLWQIRRERVSRAYMGRER